MKHFEHKWIFWKTLKQDSTRRFSALHSIYYLRTYNNMIYRSTYSRPVTHEAKPNKCWCVTLLKATVKSTLNIPSSSASQ